MVCLFRFIEKRVEYDYDIKCYVQSLLVVHLWESKGNLEEAHQEDPQEDEEDQDVQQQDDLQEDEEDLKEPGLKDLKQEQEIAEVEVEI